MMTLEGKKTYITAMVLALASFALAMGWLSKDQYQVILGLLGSLGLAALRSGVAKGGGPAGPVPPEPGVTPGEPSDK
jgi:hypothetical protein